MAQKDVSLKRWIGFKFGCLSLKNRIALLISTSVGVTRSGGWGKFEAGRVELDVASSCLKSGVCCRVLKSLYFSSLGPYRGALEGV